ncbi:ParB/RepB/Spo0J family partition protein [Streptomyces collinus]|uniref:ParB/RepB/Spo0J family partition protein n=1 Tax=Streptomyces collinus TaxID=42684 RepID=UPI00368401BC
MPVIRMIPTDRIDRVPAPASAHLDPMDPADLIAAVADLGKRITVRWVQGGRYQLVIGEAQWAQARTSRQPMIEATVLNVPSDDRAWNLLHAVALQIGGPDITPLEEAVLFRRLADAGIGHDRIAKACGKFPTYIRWRIELLDLCPAGQTALSKGRLPVGLAWYISRLAPARQTPFLNRWLRGEFHGPREAQDAARDLRQAS